MSLLEDVFLEDEAGEAQELERVIDGDEFEERPRTPNSNDDSEKEGEAEEDKRRVDHTAKAKKVVKNPRFVLNPARLTGPRGIQIIPEHFKDFKFKGKGHERDDLDLILKKLEHWAYRLYPKFEFDDCLKKIETLGKKRPVMVHLHKIRTDQFMSEETVVQRDSSSDEAEAPAPAAPEDEFDRLLQQQIEIARSTPAPGSVKKQLQTPVANRSLLAPKATSSPSISDEQKERMLRNRKLAEERRLARLNQLNKTVMNSNTSTEPVTKDNESTEMMDKDGNIHDYIVNDKDDVHVVKKLNRSNVIDSSDEESDVLTVNESITVDVHGKVRNGGTNTDRENMEAEEMTMEPENRVNRIIDEKKKENESEVHDFIINNKDDDVHVVKKHNRSNVIDSSDEESDVLAVNESIAVDVHNQIRHGETNSDKENMEAEEMKMEPEYQVDTINKKNMIEHESEVHDSIVNDKDDDLHAVRKLNRSNVIDSSDEESQILVNESIRDDVHNKVQNNKINSDKEEDMTMEPEKLVYRTNDEIMNKDIVIKESSSNDQVVHGNHTNYEVNEGELQKDNVAYEHESNVTDKAECLNNKRTLDEISENGKVSATDDLMDVDFSDDF